MTRTQLVGLFPWIQINAPVCWEGCLAVPWQQGQDSGRFDWLLSSLRTSTGHELEGCTVLLDPVGRAYPNSPSAADLFHDFTDAMTFCGLLKRRLCTPDWMSPYVNASSFRLIMRAFGGDSNAVLERSRRRDGKTWIVADPKVYRVHQPNHVSLLREYSPSRTTLRSLAVARRRTDVWRWAQTSMQYLAAANTDSPDLDPNTEIVLLMSAMQAACQEFSGNKAKVRRAVLSSLGSISPPSLTAKDSRRAARFKNSKDLREIWFDDFGNCRNEQAHGNIHSPKELCWSLAEHAALASFIVPYVILARLGSAGCWTTGGAAKTMVDAFDQLLCLPSFAPTRQANGMQSFPWANTVDSVVKAAKEAVWKENAIRALESMREEKENPLSDNPDDLG